MYARQITADHGFGLNDSLAAKHDVLGPDQNSLARHLVAGILERCLSV